MDVMEILKEYSIPIKGLLVGEHVFRYEVDSEFFSEFENSTIKNGAFGVDIKFDRRPDMLIIDFNIEGYELTSCDRCLTEIQVPASGTHELIVKFEEDMEDTDEIIFISPNESHINVAPFIFEYIHYSTPIKKVRDCDQEANKYCDLDALNKLDAAADEDGGSALRNALKDLNFK